MVAHGRVELLAHPLSQKYLQMKWNTYGKYFHVTNLLIYTVFLSFVTLYASLLMQNLNYEVNHANGSSITENVTMATVCMPYKQISHEIKENLFGTIFYVVAAVTESRTTCLS